MLAAILGGLLLVGVLAVTGRRRDRRLIRECRSGLMTFNEIRRRM